MEPNFRPNLYVNQLLDRFDFFPLENGVCFPGHESPVKTPYVLAGKYRQVGPDQTSSGACHPFCADHRAPVCLKLTDFGLELLRFPVMVEGDHIRCSQLELIQGLVIEPEPDSQRLRGVDLACPIEDGLDQGQGFFLVAAVAGFIVQVPKQDALVLCEVTQDILDIGFQAPPGGWTLIHHGNTRALDPAGVVDTRFGCRLHPGFGIRIPTIVEDHQYRVDSVPGSDIQELTDSLLETAWVGFPGQVMQERPCGIEADSCCPAKLTVDGGGVECLCLPHLQLVDGIAGYETAAYQPGLAGVPFICFFSGPPPGSVHCPLHSVPVFLEAKLNVRSRV